MGRLTARPTRMALLAVFVAIQLVVAGPRAVARAESLLWTLTASPLVATTGVPQTFTITATNTDPLADVVSSQEIGCVVVTMPNFSISAAIVTGSNAGGSWHVDSVVGGTVTVHADSGGDRLGAFDWVTFTATATAHSAGSPTWSARAFRQHDCSGSGALLGVSPTVSVSGPAPTPTPVPTLSPTPTPTLAPTTPSPRPTPTPAPTPTLPVPLPTLPVRLPTDPLQTPGPTDRPAPSTGPSPVGTRGPDATPGPDESPRPEATQDPEEEAASTDAARGGTPPAPSASPGAAAPPAAGGGPAAPGALPRMRFDDARLDLDLGGIAMLAGVEVWAVPAATIAVPGLLVLLWVALQAAGAIAWMPATRRFKREVPTHVARRAP